MRNRLVILSALILLFTGIHAGGKNELQWRSFGAGFAEAKKNDKKILLDVYTDWCGWCKKLDRDVYTNAEVSGYLNKQYVVIKLNAESADLIQFGDTTYRQMDFAQACGVTSYPTFIFFDASGQPITLMSGYMEAAKFLPVLNYIGEDYYKTMEWEEYAKKQKTPEAKKDGMKK